MLDFTIIYFYYFIIKLKKFSEQINSIYHYFNIKNKNHFDFILSQIIFLIINIQITLSHSHSKLILYIVATSLQAALKL